MWVQNRTTSTPNPNTSFFVEGRIWNNLNSPCIRYKIKSNWKRTRLLDLCLTIKLDRSSKQAVSLMQWSKWTRNQDCIFYLRSWPNGFVNLLFCLGPTDLFICLKRIRKRYAFASEYSYVGIIFQELWTALIVSSHRNIVYVWIDKMNVHKLLGFPGIRIQIMRVLCNRILVTSMSSQIHHLASSQIYDRSVHFWTMKCLIIDKLTI